jgi:hypothetical protein
MENRYLARKLRAGTRAARIVEAVLRDSPVEGLALHDLSRSELGEVTFGRFERLFNNEHSRSGV